MTANPSDRGARGSQRVPPQILRAAAQALARHRRAARSAVLPAAASARRIAGSAGPSGKGYLASDRAPGNWSGPREDRRDPATVGALYAEVSTEQGWREPVSVYALQHNWASIVGSALASRVRVFHYRPDDPKPSRAEDSAGLASLANPRPTPKPATLPGLDPAGSAETASGAEASQEPNQHGGGLLVLQVVEASFSVELGYLLPQVQEAIDRALGQGVVGRIEVIGPDQSRPRGRRTVPRAGRRRNA